VCVPTASPCGEEGSGDALGCDLTMGVPERCGAGLVNCRCRFDPVWRQPNGQGRCGVDGLGCRPANARSGEAVSPRVGWGEFGPCPDFESYTLAFALQLRKIMENLRVAERRSADPSAICLVDFAIAGDGLVWPAGPCRPWLSRQATGSTLGQHKYLPSCHNRGFPTSANFESKLSVRALMWSAKSGTPRS